MSKANFNRAPWRMSFVLVMVACAAAGCATDDVAVYGATADGLVDRDAVVGVGADAGVVDEAENAADFDISEFTGGPGAASNVASAADDAKDSVATDAAGYPGMIANASVSEGENVLPQTLLHLKGDQSAPVDGCKAPQYAWTAKQPPNAQQAFFPGPGFPNPMFKAIVPGEYEFCLRIRCAEGAQWSEPSCLTVLVLPEMAIHVELLWHTPGDPDETDVGPTMGSDMDLHVASHLATGSGADIDCDGEPDPWFHNPYDTFWFNPHPNWGGAGTAPVMDLDDTDGAGPENLTIEQSAGTVTKPHHYIIGVHYWNDHSFGSSLATINIYINGVLVAHFEKVKLDKLDMWTVGHINWPNQLTDKAAASIPAFELCRQSSPPCEGGKKWTATGGMCIAKNYANPTFTSSQTTAKP